MDAPVYVRMPYMHESIMSRSYIAAAAPDHSFCPQWVRRNDLECLQSFVKPIAPLD